MDSKTLLRTQALARRNGLAAACRKEKSAIICDLLEKQAESALQRAAMAEGSGERAAGAGQAEPQAPHVSPPRKAPRQVVSADVSDQGRTMRIAAYAPLRAEVDVMPFVEAAYRHAWDVCFPAMVKSDGAPAAMSFFLVPRQRFNQARLTFLKNPIHSYAANELEEEGFERIGPESLDFVIVPLVAFDAAGNRLGYGGGNYDRMLPRLRPDASIVGVAFSEQQVAEVPIERHDQPLPLVISA